MNEAEDPQQEQILAAEYMQKRGYDQPVQTGSSMHLGSLRVPKIRSVLNVQLEELRRQVAEREALLKELDGQPQLESLLDRMRRVGV